MAYGALTSTELVASAGRQLQHWHVEVLKRIDVMIFHTIAGQRLGFKAQNSWCAHLL